MKEKIRELESENETLRQANKEIADMYHAKCRELAAANALLEDAVEHLDQTPLLVSEIEEYLAGQPVAPMHCSLCGEPHGGACPYAETK